VSVQMVAVKKAELEAEVSMFQPVPSVREDADCVHSLSGRSMSATAEALNNSLEGFVWVQETVKNTIMRYCICKSAALCQNTELIRDWCLPGTRKN